MLIVREELRNAAKAELTPSVPVWQMDQSSRSTSGHNVRRLLQLCAAQARIQNMFSSIGPRGDPRIKDFRSGISERMQLRVAPAPSREDAAFAQQPHAHGEDDPHKGSPRKYHGRAKARKAQPAGDGKSRQAETP